MRLFKSKLLVSTIAAVVTLTASVGVVRATTKTDEAFETLRTVYNIVEKYHKDGADAERFVNGAIKGGLEALGDPYTNYFAPGEFDAFLDSLNGSFSGIGAYLEQDEQYVVISSPIKGGPAAAAGLRSGDRLLEVDGTSLVGASTDLAVSKIRGEAGTTVTLKIERPSEKRTFTVTLTRAVVSIPEVEYKMLENQVGYIQLSSFGDDAVGDFYTAVGKLKGQGAKGIVLDLRQNGGGYLQAAVQIASAFVPEDEPVVWEVGKAGKSSLRSTGRAINMPAAVLIDNGSASASEVLAGAIQDYKAAPLVGVKSFGKGTVQQILFLSSGGGMKVTIAEYLTAKERHVHGIGLTPDYVVENHKPALEHTAPLELKRDERPILPSTAGLDVLYIQYRLKDLGYKPDMTGFFGIGTVDAVTKFRKDNGLTAECKVDQSFINVLNRRVNEYWTSGQATDLQLQKAVSLVQEQIKQ